MSIRIEQPIGFTNWAQDFEADQFEPGVLTITDPTSGRVVDTYQPNRWLRAIVHGHAGYVQYVQENPFAQEAHRAALEQARAIADQFRQLDAERDAKKAEAAL